MSNERHLFRGRRVYDGEWAIGSHTVVPRPMILFWADEDEEQWDYADIDPTTLGQCTGLYAAKSCRGDRPEDRLIFEGDVIELEAEDGEIVQAICEFGTARRLMTEDIVDITGFYFYRTDCNFKSFPIVCNYRNKHDLDIFRIIGTIHDDEGA